MKKSFAGLRPSEIAIQVGLTGHYTDEQDYTTFLLEVTEITKNERVALLSFTAGKGQKTIGMNKIEVSPRYRGYGIGETLYQYLFDCTSGHDYIGDISDSGSDFEFGKKYGFEYLEPSGITGDFYEKKATTGATRKDLSQSSFPTKQYKLKRKKNDVREQEIMQEIQDEENELAENIQKQKNKKTESEHARLYGLNDLYIPWDWFEEEFEEINRTKKADEISTTEF
jgi:GNAT superfamily N-acetyltransferase